MRLLALLVATARIVTALATSYSSQQDVEERGHEHADSLAARSIPDEETLTKQAQAEGRRVCVVKPDAHGGDDAPNIMDAMNHQCRSHSLIYLPGPTYHINTNMTTLDMNDVQIVLLGRMLWSQDIDYWLSVSMPINFQNQSTVWYFGGNKVTLDGHSVGTFDGNGQVWYDWAKSKGNLAHRPMMVNFRKLTNSTIQRMRFVQAQMWTMAVTYSQHVELNDIYVNNTSNSQWSTLNTDGCDTVNSDSITFRRWDITNGDDAIALKRNSSNISVYDSIFRDGQGIAIGSMGQYNGQYEYLTNFYARNITLINTAHVSYLKTWSGVSRGYPPNGGGGGLGHASNIVIEDVKVEGLRSQPFFAWQCENYSGYAGKDCDSSKFQMYDFAWRHVSGTISSSVKDVASIQCSAGAGGCHGVEISDVSVRKAGSSSNFNEYHCENVHDPKGFTCNDD